MTIELRTGPEEQFPDDRPPVKLITPMDLAGRLQSLYRNGMPGGTPSGWPSLDRHLTISPGLLTIVTGWPHSGKSEFVDALVLNLITAGWRAAFYSPENQPPELHLAKLIEKRVGAPFGDGPRRRIEPEQMAAAMAVLDDAVTWIPITNAQGDARSMVDILDAADCWLETGGKIRREWDLPALVIDPWNEISHQRASHVTETEHVSQQLGMLRRWARDRGIHVFLVAHPAKMQRDKSGKLPVPRPDMIAGSQHFWNKADNCVTVWRDMHTEQASPVVEIHVQKVRFKHHGRIGMVELEYDRLTGRYSDPGSKVVPIHGRKAKTKPLDDQEEIEL